MKNNYDRSISLICAICASDQFEFDADLPEEERVYTCGDCHEVYSHDEIISKNSEKLSKMVDEIGKEFVADATKKLKKAFSKFGK
ncbi:MAG: hypothetical protein L3J33_05430 [Rhodobacteraceae bacterium]|nr:hypothetical protein [Paracoccaceae bacterium]